MHKDDSRNPALDDQMFEQFREIRRRVWFEATGNKPENQSKFKEMAVELSDKANLSYWRTNAPEVRSEIWEQVVEKIFYAGFDASKVNSVMNSIRAQFGDYKSLCSPHWEVRIKNRRISDDSGPLARAYGADDGLEGKIRHAYKIRKIVEVGRYFNSYFDRNREASALSIILQGKDSEDVWVVSGNLDDIGLSGRLTQLHLLMDLGFDCIKPDIVISRLVLSLGWLAHFAPELPADLQEADLRGEGKYRSKYHYTNDVVIRPIVNLAREFASRMRQERKALEEDIGWISSNPIREFDIFMVSYGQRPDPNVGIEIQLWSGDSNEPGARGCAISTSRFLRQPDPRSHFSESKS
jgi:hypothetical protein